MNLYTEDNLVQKTTAEYLVDTLKWDESIYAMQEVFGAVGTLGRVDESEVLLLRYLRPALERLNPDLPAAVYDDAAIDEHGAEFRAGDGDRAAFHGEAAVIYRHAAAGAGCIAGDRTAFHGEAAAADDHAAA